jgi:hypothetical protein
MTRDINPATGQHFPTAQFRRKDTVHRPLFWPTNEAARLFCRIAGDEYLTLEVLDLIRQFGFRTEAMPERFVSLSEELGRIRAADRFGDTVVEPGNGMVNPYKKPRTARPLLVNEEA